MLVIAGLAFVALSAAVATRSLVAWAALTFSLSAATLLSAALAGWGPGYLCAALGCALACTAWVYGALRADVFRAPSGAEIKLWRIAARPFALAFIPIQARWGHRFVLLLVGVVAAVFIVTDLVRMFSSVRLDRLYKKGERKRLSSITAFLVAVFVAFLVFEPPISYLSLAFLTVGDLCGKLVGIRYGRIRLLERRTLEGTLGFAAGAVAAGSALYPWYPYPPLYLVVGAASATLIELFSQHVDDNLSVGLVTGAVLSALRLFLHV